MKKIFYSGPALIAASLLLVLFPGYPVAAQNYTLYLPLMSKPPVVLNGDFENGRDNSWKEDAPDFDNILILNYTELPEFPLSGEWAVWLGGNDDVKSTLSQVVTIPKDGTYHLNYYYYIMSFEDSCGKDFVVVRLGGIQINKHELCKSNPDNEIGWISLEDEGQQIDLSAFQGQRLELSFEVSIDPNPGTWSNFLLDDVSIRR